MLLSGVVTQTILFSSIALSQAVGASIPGPVLLKGTLLRARFVGSGAGSKAVNTSSIPLHLLQICTRKSFVHEKGKVQDA